LPGVPVNARQVLSLCRQAIGAWVDDFAPSMGAAIAYYTAFSLAPLLVIVIAVSGAIFGREAVTGQITQQLSDLIGGEGARLVQGLIASASDTERGLVAGTISTIVLFVGADLLILSLWNRRRRRRGRPDTTEAVALPAPIGSGGIAATARRAACPGSRICSRTVPASR